MSVLESGLKHAEEQAAALEDRLSTSPPEPTDLARLGDRAELVERLVADFSEATRQLAVAGLAYPDPELPDELIALASRARRHGLPSAVRSLLRLRTYLTALQHDPDEAHRTELTTAAWEETQRFVSWLRLFRVENDLLMVQGRLAAQTRSADPDATPAVPTTSVTVRPLGLSFRGRGRLVMHGYGLEGEAVEIHDELAEWDPEDPVHTAVISRLFQDRVVLGRVLEGVIRFEDHPVALADDGTLILRPAFRARPRSLAISEDFPSPELHPVPLSTEGTPDLEGLPARPHRLELDVVRTGRVTTLRTVRGASTGLPSSELLRFSLTKLLLREGSGRERVRATVVPAGDGPVLIALSTDFDGQTLPHLDPSLYRLDPVVLARRASRDPAGGIAGAWLRTTAYLFGGADAKAVEALREAVAELQPNGVRERYRLGLCAALLGLPTEPFRSWASSLANALRIGATDPQDPVDLGLLAEVLGEDTATEHDRSRVDAETLYAAVWLVEWLELQAPLGTELRALFDGRFSGELSDPSFAEVCARALLVNQLETTPEEDEEDLGTALPFLHAHLAPLRDTRGRTAPLPTLLELLQLGDTLARLAHTDPLGPTVAHLSLAPERLRTPVLDALYQAFTSSPDPIRTGDALAVLAASTLRPWFLLD